MGNDMKNILYSWFSNSTLTETRRQQIYSLSLYLKKNSRVDSFAGNESKPSRIVERSEMMLKLIHIIADQNSYHDDKST